MKLNPRWESCSKLPVLMLLSLLATVDSLSSRGAAPPFYSSSSSASSFLRDIGASQLFKGYGTGPFGIVIRGWQFRRCASEQWSTYSLNITNVELSPTYPRFPGKVDFKISFDVLQTLPHDTELELEVEVRHRKVQRGAGGRRGRGGGVRNSQTSWPLIPCHGWDLSTGCGGAGSCRYCNILETCRTSAKKAEEHTDDRKVLKILRDTAKICPPPRGTWTISYKKKFDIDDLEKGLLGPLQSNQYWFTVTVTDGRGNNLGCFKLWLDICKYHYYDKDMRCRNDPQALNNFIANIAKEASSIFGQDTFSKHSKQPFFSQNRG